ncbi:hypothetical protein Hanom_Chr00s003460g01712371 [Helianthus anomalus]
MGREAIFASFYFLKICLLIKGCGGVWVSLFKLKMIFCEKDLLTYHFLKRTF